MLSLNKLLNPVLLNTTLNRTTTNISENNTDYYVLVTPAFPFYEVLHPTLQQIQWHVSKTDCCFKLLIAEML